MARTLDDIPDMFASAVREAIASFGHGECFVERYLHQPRHVETQCLADVHGNVVVISTRDCSLQRRHQKLVEEAPAPFLTDAEVATLYASSKNILRAAGYVGAGTCEFLLGTDGTISFLEVNARIQVEHPVTEEISGIDLIREQFRLADGEALGYDDPPLRGHSIEFRINGEDPGRGFVPAPGRVTSWRPPTGPGVRLDSGVEAGSVVPQAFDSLLAKLIVTGADRTQALARARRALAEFEIDGMATALTFHRVVVDDPAFAPPDPETPFSVHTRWIETEFVNTIDAVYELPPLSTSPRHGRPSPSRSPASGSKSRYRQTFNAGPNRRPAGGAASHRTDRARTAGGKLTAPMQGTIVKVAVSNGDAVELGDLVVVLEAMKMEQPLTAHRSGTIAELAAEPGQTVAGGAVICEIR